MEEKDVWSKCEILWVSWGVDLGMKKKKKKKTKTKKKNDDDDDDDDDDHDHDHDDDDDDGGRGSKWGAPRTEWVCESTWSF